MINTHPAKRCDNPFPQYPRLAMLSTSFLLVEGWSGGRDLGTRHIAPHQTRGGDHRQTPYSKKCQKTRKTTTRELYSFRHVKKYKHMNLIPGSWATIHPATQKATQILLSSNWWGWTFRESHTQDTLSSAQRRWLMNRVHSTTKNNGPSRPKKKQQSDMIKILSGKKNACFDSSNVVQTTNATPSSKKIRKENTHPASRIYTPFSHNLFDVPQSAAGKYVLASLENIADDVPDEKPSANQIRLRRFAHSPVGPLTSLRAATYHPRVAHPVNHSAIQSVRSPVRTHVVIYERHPTCAGKHDDVRI